MIIDLTSYTKSQDSQIEKYFANQRHTNNQLFELLPACIKDFIERHTGIYILIHKLLSQKNLKISHINTAKRMVQNSRQVHIHLPKSENAGEYFQKLIEKAEYSNTSSAKELSKCMHSLQCGLIDGKQESAFQKFKKSWTSFIDHQLNEMINETLEAS